MILLPTDTEPVTVLEGDCLEVLPRLPPECATAVVTDPPYGTTDDRLRVGIKGNRIEAFGYEWDKTLPTDWLIWAFRLLVPGGSLLTFTDTKRVGELWDAGERVGLHGLQLFFWEKPDPPPTPRPNFVSSVESGVFFRKPGRVHRWNGGGYQRNIFHAPLAHKEHDGQTRYHPTEKPLSLMRELVRLVSDPGDLIIDPFAGSGTTGRAAVAEGRRAILVENDPVHAATCRCQIAKMLNEEVLIPRSAVIRKQKPDVLF